MKINSDSGHLGWNSQHLVGRISTFQRI